MDDTEDKNWQIAYKIQGSFIITLNALLLMVILYRKKLRRKSSNKFLCSLLLTHFVFGCLDFYFGFTITHNDVQQNKIETMKLEEKIKHQSLDFITSILICLFLNLSTVTLDRLISIKYPFTYEKLTTKKSILVIIVIWILSISYMPLSIAYNLTRHAAEIITVTLSLLSVIILAIANGLIYQIVRKQIKQIKATLVVGQTEKLKQKLRHQKLKSFYLCLGMVVSYVVFWLPLIIQDIIQLSAIQVEKYSNYATFTAICNSLADPIIYILINKEIKKEIRTMVRKAMDRDISQQTMSVSNDTL